MMFYYKLKALEKRHPDNPGKAYLYCAFLHNLIMKGVIMSRFFYFCMVAFLVMTIGCNEKDINGKWKGEMQTPNGPFELIYDFNVIGDSLAGTVTSPMGALPISNGKVNGEMFSFDVDVNGMTFSQQCKFMNDSISLKVNGMQGEPREMILKRVPEPKDESM